MNEYATKNDVQEIVNTAVNKAVTDLSEIIATFAGQVDDRFNRVEERLDKLEASHQRLLNTVDAFVARIDTYETEQTARDAQFARLLEWAKEVSKKTGIPLKGF